MICRAKRRITRDRSFFPMDGQTPTSGAVIQALFDPIRDWREVATNVHGRALQCGHFIPEEQPALLAQQLLDFFGD